MRPFEACDGDFHLAQPRLDRADLAADLMQFATQFVDLLVHQFELTIDPLELTIDPFEPEINLLEPTVDLLEPTAQSPFQSTQHRMETAEDGRDRTDNHSYHADRIGRHSGPSLPDANFRACPSKYPSAPRRVTG